MVMPIDEVRCNRTVTRRSATGKGCRVLSTRRIRWIVLISSLVLQVPSPSARALELVREPYLQQGTPTSMIVRWRTDVPADTTLRYGPAPDDLSTTISDLGLVVEHEVEVQDLQPFTRYYYSVGTSTEVLAGMDATTYFATSPPAGTHRATRIWVIGDSGEINVEALQVRDAYLSFAGDDLADVWLMLGDNAYLTGTDSEYTVKLFDKFSAILRNTVLWPTPGNHDFTGGPDNAPPSSSPVTEVGPYYDSFTLPTQGEAGGVPSGTETYYSFDYANIHFVSLNTYKIDVSVGSEVYNWVVADLDATNQDWVIVYLHMAPYSKGTHDSDSDVHMTRVRTIYNPVFEERGVDLVLAGHSHNYERSMLIDGHYGLSSTFGPEHVVDGGDGDPLGDGPYVKPGPGRIPHAGTVYVVNGAAATVPVPGGTLDHPAMISAFEIQGSTLIDVAGNTLDAYFLSRDGDILDRFQIVKDIPVPASGPAALIVLVVALPISAWIVRRRS